MTMIKKIREKGKVASNLKHKIIASFHQARSLCHLRGVVNLRLQIKCLFAVTVGCSLVMLAKLVATR